MPARKDTGRIAWLTAKLGTQKSRIVKMLQRLGDLGPMQAMKPKVFTKFLKLMEQIADEQDKEANIISEIEAIERKHRYQRKSGKLKRAEPPVDDFGFNVSVEERPRNGWIWALVLWYMMTRQNRPDINKT